MEGSLTAPYGLGCPRCEAKFAAQVNVQDGGLAEPAAPARAGHALSRAFQTCVECPDYSCAELDQLLAHTPAQRVVFEPMR